MLPRSFNDTNQILRANFYLKGRISYNEVNLSWPTQEACRKSWPAIATKNLPLTCLLLPWPSTRHDSPRELPFAFPVSPLDCTRQPNAIYVELDTTTSR
jgi:hypothetical protein